MVGLLLQGKLVYWIAPFALLGACLAYWYAPSWSVVLLCAYWLFHEVLLVFEIPMKASFWPDLIVALFSLLWLIRTIQERGNNVVRGPLTTAILLYLAMLLVQAFRAPTLLAGFFGFKWWAMHIFLYFLASDHSFDRDRLQQFLMLLMGAGALKGLFHLGQFLFPSIFPSSFEVGGPQYGAHSFMVTLLVPLSILNITWLLTQPGRQRAIYLFITLGGLLIGQVVSLARAVWFSFGSGLALVAYGNRRVDALVALIVLMGITWWAMPPLAQSRFLAGFQEERGTYTIYDKWNSTMAITGKAMQRNPWGFGLGSVTSKDATRRVGQEALQNIGLYPESGFGETIIEMGLLGLLVYLNVFWAAGRETWQAFRRMQDPFSAAFSLGMLAIVGSTFLGEIFIEFVYSSSFYFWYLLGLFARFAAEKESTGEDQNQALTSHFQLSSG